VIADALDSAQRGAVEAPFDAGLAIVGAPATGKTTALLARLDRARSLGYATPLLGGVDESASERMQQLADELLRDAGITLAIVDDVEAESLFEQAAAPLLAMESDLVELQIDPEVPGLRSPERFLQSAFRLARRLAEALFDADAFLEKALAGATEFYANPPNLAHPNLITATKSEYRNSLAVGAAELERQYRREVDLAKLLAQLFRAYARLLGERGCATGRDAVAQAVALLRATPSAADGLRERYGLAFLDDAHELTAGEHALLRGVFGERLRGVTVVGDAGEAATRLEMKTSFRVRPHPSKRRPATQREEAREVAAHVAQLVRTEPAARVAVLVRSVAHASIYEEALLDRGIPVQIGGDYNVFADRRAHDALALLWNVHDPYRHDWLLRTLEGNAMALSDASLAVLCGEPAEKQTVLFDDQAPKTPPGPSKRDPDRDVRLARNVLTGACDERLSDLARERVAHFRSLREVWAGAQQSMEFEGFVRSVWEQGLAREGAPGSARAQAQQRTLEALLERLLAAREAHPQWGLGELLEDAERRANSELETCGAPQGEGVHLLSVPCARGAGFDHVAIAGAHPGAFPRWYAPDAFLFSPILGMIPKDNVGDAPTARTAKFTYYLYRVKAAERYYRRERALFEYALSRAKTSLLVTAWGRPTRGVTAPEFLEELR
jgi:superfamily I DNA/RNA helicase